MGKPIVIGVDVGGTKIAIGLVNELGQVLASGRYPTKSHEGRDAILEQIIRYVTVFRDQANGLGMIPAAVGVATPGLFDYQQGRVRFATTNLSDWTGVPLVAEIEQALHLPCVVENDANAAAVAESIIGSGANFKDVLYISVGTGVGGGIVINGQLIRGCLGGAGGFGHISIDHSGPKCYCGNQGCVELFASGKAIAKQARCILGVSGTHDSPVNSNEDVNGQVNEQLLEVRYVLNQAERGNAAAQEIIRKTGMYLGFAAASAVNLLNPEIIVMGGGLAAAGNLLFEPMRQIIKERTFPPVGQQLNLEKAKLGGHAGLVGASLLAWDQLKADYRRNEYHNDISR